MGMSFDEFWNGDPEATKAYREANRIKAEHENYLAWLQGMYIYEALCDAAPLFRSFAKPGTRANPYPEKPFEFRKPVKTKKEKDRQTMEAGKAQMKKIAELFNASFRRRKQRELDGQKPEENQSNNP